MKRKYKSGEQKDPTEGMKYDGGKPRWDLLPMDVLEEVVEILTMGARKYTPDNWKYVDNAENRYYAALMRHLVAWRKGEKMDPESGKNHLAHVGCCLIFLHYFDLHRRDKRNEETEKKAGERKDNKKTHHKPGREIAKR